MFHHIDHQWQTEGRAVARISTGDLAKSVAQIEHLSQLKNLKGVLMTSDRKAKPVYFPVCQDMKHYRCTMIQAVLLLASAGALFSQIHAVQNEADLPTDTQIIKLSNRTLDTRMLPHAGGLTR